MYPNDQSISSYSSNPSTPVNSPPPLTQTPGTALSLHNSTPSTSWQQLTPANVLNNSPAPVLNGLQNGQYAPDLVHRSMHMVSTVINHIRFMSCFVLNHRSEVYVKLLSLHAICSMWLNENINFFGFVFSFLYASCWNCVFYVFNQFNNRKKANQPELLDEAFGMLRDQAENTTVSCEHWNWLVDWYVLSWISIEHLCSW